MLASFPAYGGGQERFALLIGANIGEPGDQPLRFAEEDARKMAHILTRFGSVPEENMLLLQGRNATRVEAAFRALTERIQTSQAAQKETVLIVYYSGHADMAAMHLGRSRFEFERLTHLLESAGATFKILIMDACRSGELTRVKGGKPAQPFRIVSTEKLKSAGFSASDIDKIKIWNSGYPKETAKGLVNCDDNSPKIRSVIQNDDADQQNPGSSSRDMGNDGCVLIKGCAVDEHRAFEVKLFTSPNGAQDNDNDFPIRVVMSSFYWYGNGLQGIPDGKSDCSLCTTNCDSCQSVPKNL